MSSAGNEDLGFQVKPMGLKVHYTFDKDSQDRCLARHPQLIHAQTLALDETTTIGLVDIRLCLQAVSQCSPELLSAFDSDYVVYAYDYSEPGAPLVGQGMLSWLLDPSRGDNAGQSLSMVTGRVTKNMLAIFGNGIKETLEVRLKLVRNSKVARADQGQGSQMQSFSQQSQMSAGTPQLDMGLPNQSAEAGTPSAEWNFFMQSMPAFDTHSHIDSPLPMDDMNTHMNHTNNATPNPQPAQNTTTTTAPAAPSRGSSRPASRTSRKRQPTGRPRGRPRKRPPPEGHTSGYEDGTDGDDNPGPARKRVATTKVADRAVAAKQDEIAALHTEMDAVLAELEDLNAQISAKEREILDTQARVAPLLAQLTAADDAVSATEAQLSTLQEQVVTLDGRLTAAQDTLRELQGTKKQHKETIAAQHAVVKELQAQLGEVQQQIRAIDGTIALGGCVA